VLFSGRRLPRPYDALEVVVRDVEPRAPGAVSEQALESNVLWRIDEDGDGRMTGWLGKVADRLTLTAPKVACAVNKALACKQHSGARFFNTLDRCKAGPTRGFARAAVWVCPRSLCRTE
jgi:hypothetical protein